MVLPSKHPSPYNIGLHTFNVYENCIFVDGYGEYYSYLLKPCFVKLRKLLQLIFNRHDNKGKEIICELEI